MTSTTETTQRRPGRTFKLIGIVLLILGLVSSALGITNVVRNVGGVFVDAVGGPVYTVPFQTTFTAKRGTNLILQDDSYRNNLSTNFAVSALQPGDVLLTGPDGSPVPVTATNGNTNVSRNGASFFDILKFQADTAGSYRLAVAEPAGLRLIVTPSFGEAFSRSAGWFSVGGVGVLVVILGAILLIVGFVQANKAKKPSQPAFGGYGAYAPPPGWYPDPQRPGATRWWDGTHWRP